MVKLGTIVTNNDYISVASSINIIYNNSKYYKETDFLEIISPKGDSMKFTKEIFDNINENSIDASERLFGIADYVKSKMEASVQGVLFNE